MNLITPPKLLTEIEEFFKKNISESQTYLRLMMDTEFRTLGTSVLSVNAVLEEIELFSQRIENKRANYIECDLYLSASNPLCFGALKTVGGWALCKQ